MKNSRILSKNSRNFAKNSIIRQLWVGVICRKMAKKQAWYNTAHNTFLYWLKNLSIDIKHQVFCCSGGSSGDCHDKSGRAQHGPRCAWQGHSGAWGCWPLKWLSSGRDVRLGQSPKACRRPRRSSSQGCFPPWDEMKWTQITGQVFFGRDKNYTLPANSDPQLPQSGVF